MTEPQQQHDKAKPRRRIFPLAVACLLLFVLGGLATALLLPRGKPEEPQSDTDVPLGVEQAVIVRYGGPRLVARPYRRGASVNLRIADETQKGPVRIYDVRYVVSLPGQFDLTEYLTSTDGQPTDDLPPFHVRGLTSLTKDIETRIQEIETVGVPIWHWYYETLVGLGLLWVAWLVGLIFVGRPKRPPKPQPAPRQPSVAEQIDRLLTAMAQEALTVDEKANLEALLLRQWREQLGLGEQRMAPSCRHIGASREFGPVYCKLQTWLHNDRAGAGPEEFVRSYNHTRRSSAVRSLASTQP